MRPGEGRDRRPWRHGRAPGGPLQELAAAASASVRVDVYVDGRGRARRLEVAEDPISTTPVTREDGYRVVTTIDVVRFGTQATIEAPAPGDVG